MNMWNNSLKAINTYIYDEMNDAIENTVTKMNLSSAFQCMIRIKTSFGVWDVVGRAYADVKGTIQNQLSP